MPNPNRKPLDRKVRQRVHKHSPELAVLPGRELVVEPPDDGWRSDTKESWSAFWGSDVAGAIDPADRHGLRRLFGMRDAQAHAFEQWKALPFIDGSQGQPVANPAFGHAMTLEHAIVALEDRLGLSPKARANLGIALGQAQMTAAELNRMAQESDDGDVDEILDAEGWEAAN